MASNKSEKKNVGASNSTVSSAPGKTTGLSRSAEQKEKRLHSEVADSSLGDEFASIQKQLDQLSADIQQTRGEFKSLMTKDEMKTFINSTIQNMTTVLQAKLEESLGQKIADKIDAEIEEKVKEKLGDVHGRLDILTFENVQLREEVDQLKSRLDKSEQKVEAAAQKANMNEQYSRKNNVKIMGVVEEEEETEESLTKKVQHILESKTGIKVVESKIMALHRIPGKSGMPKPVLLKLTNNSEKSKIMKKRREMKRAGYRLVDDVTKQNTMLINRLTQHKDIESAWYFNGNVFGKSKTGKRYKFEIYSDIDEILAR